MRILGQAAIQAGLRSASPYQYNAGHDAPWQHAAFVQGKYHDHERSGADRHQFGRDTGPQHQRRPGAIGTAIDSCPVEAPCYDIKVYYQRSEYIGRGREAGRYESGGARPRTVCSAGYGQACESHLWSRLTLIAHCGSGQDRCNASQSRSLRTGRRRSRSHRYPEGGDGHGGTRAAERSGGSGRQQGRSDAGTRHCGTRSRVGGPGWIEAGRRSV